MSRNGTISNDISRQKERRAWRDGFAAGEKAALKGATPEAFKRAFAGASSETFEIAMLFNRTPPELRAKLTDAIARTIRTTVAKLQAAPTSEETWERMRQASLAGSGMCAIRADFHVTTDALERRREEDERNGKPWGDRLGKPMEERPGYEAPPHLAEVIPLFTRAGRPSPG